MKFRAAETARGEYPDRVSVGLHERYDVDDDGTFEIPDDDLDTATRRRLEEAGHTPLPDAEPEAEEEAEGEEQKGDDADQDGETTDSEPDDEYADMDRAELYEVYKERGGPASWNETTADLLRESLRIHDEHETFPDPDEI